MRTPEVEPDVSSWEVATFDDVARRLGDSRSNDGGSMIVAVDGRSGSGKSTFAERLSNRVNDSAIVHTDDIAWWESFFDWGHLLIDGILLPVSRGEPVSYRPPAWRRHNRVGAIEIPPNVAMLFVEGAGASRRSFRHWLQTSIWVQSDLNEARRRGIERDGGTAEAAAFWDEWQREELPFFAEDRPWERSQLVVCGTPAATSVAHDSANEVLLAR